MEKTLYNDVNWREGAACLRENPDDFFPEGSETGKVPEWIAQLCGECAVKAFCLDDAIRTNTRFGIRGGVNMGSGARNRMAAWRQRQREQLAS